VLGKLLKRCGDGILYNDHEAGAIGPRLFEQACKMGMEGIVSKHRDRTGRIAALDQGQETPSRPPWFAPRMGHGDTRTEDHLGANAPDGRSRPSDLLL
jgi:hypothetical protein